MTYTITYHPEKEVNYRWKLTVLDGFSKMTIHFKTKKLAERYVFITTLQYGEII